MENRHPSGELQLRPGELAARPPVCQQCFDNAVEVVVRGDLAVELAWSFRFFWSQILVEGLS